MKTFRPLFVCLIFLIAPVGAQQTQLSNTYFAEQEKLNASFSAFYYGHFDSLYALQTEDFLGQMEIWQLKFDSLLQSSTSLLSDSIITREKNEIKYAFDTFIVNYPYHHSRTNRQKIAPNAIIDKKLSGNLKDLNNARLLQFDGFKDYLKAFLYVRSKLELQNPDYKHVDNQQLRATWKLISEYITNPLMVAYLKHNYLYDYIDRFGIKNIEDLYDDFIKTCTDSGYLHSVRSYYEKEKEGRADHTIKTYKTVDGFALDIHLFLPQQMDTDKKYPVMVNFHGGSWSEGKPDWFFPAARRYVKEGWVAAAVEYRLAYRHGSLPFQSLMDAKSAIRWLRQQAKELHIDANRIVVSGNSAGGHLALATALVENWNETTDNLNFSARPNLLLINSGVYDLTDANNWIRQGLRERGMDEKLVEEISPLYLTAQELPPTLIIHGTQDRNIPILSAQRFVRQMKEAGQPVEFHALQGANHYIWFGKYARQVSELRVRFLKQHGY